MHLQFGLIRTHITLIIRIFTNLFFLSVQKTTLGKRITVMYPQLI